MRKLTIAALPLALAVAACDTEPDTAPTAQEDAIGGEAPEEGAAMGDPATLDDDAATDLRSSDELGERAENLEDRAEEAATAEAERTQGKRVPAD